MGGQGTLINNLLGNGSFSKYGTEWTTQDTVDYSRQYCRVLNGQASQAINATAETTYLLKFWSQVLYQGKGELLIQPDIPVPTCESHSTTFICGENKRSASPPRLQQPS